MTLDEVAAEEMDREAALLFLQYADEVPAGKPAWLLLASLAAADLSSLLGMPAAGSTDLIYFNALSTSVLRPARLLRLPGGVRLGLTFRHPVAVNDAGLRTAWAHLRPWRIRRGIQILRAAQSWVASEIERRTTENAQ